MPVSHRAGCIISTYTPFHRVCSGDGTGTGTGTGDGFGNDYNTELPLTERNEDVYSSRRSALLAGLSPRVDTLESRFVGGLTILQAIKRNSP